MSNPTQPTSSSKIKVRKLGKNIPTLSLAKTEQTKDPKKLQRLSFSEEFKEKITEKKKTITVRYNGEEFDQEMDIGHTVRNLIKIIEAKYNLPKDKLQLTYKETFLLCCLSISDIPELMNDEKPIVDAKLEN